jgi:hypothetical protein
MIRRASAFAWHCPTLSEVSRRKLVGLGLAVVLGCTATPTTPLVTSAPSPSRSPAPHATPAASVETTSPTPSWRTGALDQKDTTRFEEYRSTGTFVIWSTSARTSAFAAPDLLGVEPGGPVELLYDNPNRDTVLSPIGGYGSRFTFVESKPQGEIAGPEALAQRILRSTATTSCGRSAPKSIIRAAGSLTTR